MVEEPVLVLVVLREKLTKAKLSLFKGNSHLVNQDGLDALEHSIGQVLSVQLDSDKSVLSLGDLLEKVGDLLVIEAEVRSLALGHRLLELLNRHCGGMARINQQQELSLVEISLFSNLRKFDDSTVHEVKLGNSLKFSHQASVLEEANVSFENVLQKGNFTWSQFDT